MFRLTLILGAASFVAVLGLSIASDAQTAAAGRPAGDKGLMDPSTQSTRSGAHVRQRPRDNYAHDHRLPALMLPVLMMLPPPTTGVPGLQPA